MRDQRTVTDWKRTIPASLRNILRTYTNVKHPIMPLGVSGYRIPNSIVSQVMVEKEKYGNGELLSESEESDVEENSDSPWGAKRCPPGLQESVCTKLKSIKIANGQEEALGNSVVNNTVSSNTEDEEEDFLSCSSSNNGSNDGYIKQSQQTDNKVTNVITNGHAVDTNKYSSGSNYDNNGSSAVKDIELNLIVEVITKYQCKPDAIYTFICAREFRRDEYASHFYEVHSKIHTQLNGWIFSRCPLANQGCSYGVERMFPISQDYKVVYNNDVDAFCVTQRESKTRCEFYIISLNKYALLFV